MTDFNDRGSGGGPSARGGYYAASPGAYSSQYQQAYQQRWNR